MPTEKEIQLLQATITLQNLTIDVMQEKLDQAAKTLGQACIVLGQLEARGLITISDDGKLLIVELAPKPQDFEQALDQWLDVNRTVSSLELWEAMSRAGFHVTEDESTQFLASSCRDGELVQIQEKPWARYRKI